MGWGRTGRDALGADFSGDFLESETDLALVLGALPVRVPRAPPELARLAPPMLLGVAANLAAREDVPRREGHTYTRRRSKKHAYSQ